MLDTHAVPMHTLTRTKKNTNIPPVTTLDAHHIYSHIYLYVCMHVPCLYDLAWAQVLLSTVYYQNDIYALLWHSWAQHIAVRKRPSEAVTMQVRVACYSPSHYIYLTSSTLPHTKHSSPVHVIRLAHSWRISNVEIKQLLPCNSMVCYTNNWN